MHKLFGFFVQNSKKRRALKVSIITLLVLGVSPVWAALPTIAEFTQNMQLKQGLIPIYYDKSADKVYLAVPQQASQFLFQSSYVSL